MISYLKIPSELYAGAGSIEKLADIVKRDSVKRVLLFTDKGIRAAGLCDGVIAILERENVDCRIFDRPSMMSMRL